MNLWKITEKLLKSSININGYITKLTLNLYAGIKYIKFNAQSVLIAVTFDKYPTALGSDQNENRVKTTQTVEIARDLPKNYLSQDLQKSNNEASAYLQLLSKICARV